MNKSKLIIFVLIYLAYCLNAFCALVSSNDGSSFITKAEFDSLKNDFQSQIDNYNHNIDSKIDTAIAAYLAGIVVAKEFDVTLLLDKNGKYGEQIIKWNSSTSGRRDSNSTKYYTVNINHYAFMYYKGTTGTTPIVNTKLLVTTTGYFPKSRATKTKITYNTWQRIDPLVDNYVTPGVLTPEVDYHMTWYELKNVTSMSSWTNTFTFGSTYIKYRDASYSYDATMPNWGHVNILYDKSNWDTSASSYVVYPFSTSKEYGFYDYPSYTENSAVGHNSSDQSWATNDTTYGTGHTCTWLYQGTSTSKSVLYHTYADWYNPTFCKDFGKSQDLIIRYWKEVSDKNNAVKNGLYIGSASAKSIKKIKFEAKSDVNGTMYMYVGSSAIDMANNLSSCESYSIGTTKSSYEYEKSGINSGDGIYVIFRPSSTSSDGYIGIENMKVCSE